MKKYLKLLTLAIALLTSDYSFSAAASEDIYGGCEHGKCNVMKVVLSNGMNVTRDADGTKLTGKFSLSGNMSLKAGDNNKDFIDSLRGIADITSLEIGDEITEEAKVAAKAERDAKRAAWRKALNSKFEK